MSVNVTIAIPIQTLLDVKEGKKTDCGDDVLQALIRAIRTAPCEFTKQPYFPPCLGDAPISKKITYTKVTRFRKPDDPPTNGVLLLVEGSVDTKKYRLDHWTKMGALRAALAKTNGIDQEDFCLYYQGRKIVNTDTPESLGLRNHDRVQMRKFIRPK